MWEDYLGQFKKRPLCGQTLAVPAHVSAAQYATNTHDSHLAVLAGTGLRGAMFVLAVCVFAIREFEDCVMYVAPGTTGCASVTLADVINGDASSILFECWCYTTVVLVAVLAIHVLFVVLCPGRAGSVGVGPLL